MLMNKILDSSSSARDEHSRSLKRSTSVASLPTPPRTHHKRSRSRARSSMSRRDSDGSISELDDDLGGGYADRIKRAKTSGNAKDNQEFSEDESPNPKRRRLLGVLPGHDEDEEDENTFWIGRVSSSHGEKRVAQKDKTEERSPSPAILSYRVKAPVSPPPSRRQPSIQPARAASVERDALVTPPRRLFLRASLPAAIAPKTPTKAQSSKIWPERDSPNNPFLVESSEKVKLRSEWDSSDDEEEVVGEAREREETPTPAYEEKPTITYVFRGQKATFHNPLYGLAPEVIAASKLPIDHPDYEATEACPPKRLFSAAKRTSQDCSREIASTEGVERAKVKPDETSGDEQCGAPSDERLSYAEPASREVSSHLVPNKGMRDTREERERKETVAKNRLAPRDGLRAGAVFAERDGPARRAMGPLRSA